MARGARDEGLRFMRGYAAFVIVPQRVDAREFECYLRPSGTS